jgi:flagellar L-ring protein precursor FlgH
MLNPSTILRASLVASLVAAATVGVGVAAAQDSSLLLEPVRSQQQQALTMENGSFMYRELPADHRPREVQLHDTLVVIVDYRTRMISEGDAEQRKNSFINQALTSWLAFDGKSIRLAPQLAGDPRVAGINNSQYRAESDLELRDAMSFKIAAEVIDIRPNGNLYIEANWEVENNEENWKTFLSGEVSRESIQPDRTVSSESIVNLNIKKKEVGMVRDGYERGWFSKFYDRYKPF